RRRDRAVARADAEHVAVFDAERARRRGAQDGGVAPRELGERVRQLLEPSVVREATVVDDGRLLEIELEPGRRLRQRRAQRSDRVAERRLRGHSGRGALRIQATLEEGFPSWLRAPLLRAEVLAQKLVSARIDLAREPREDVGNAARRIERLDQG